jgi:chemotaxis protein MotA
MKEPIVISILFGIAGFVFSVWFVIVNPFPNSGGYIDYASAVLLLVGPISIIFVSHNFIDFLRGVRVLLTMASLSQKREMDQISNQLTQLSASVRTEGMGVVARFKDQVKNQLFRDGLQLILSSFSADEIKHNLVAKINASQNQYGHAQNLFESLSKLCPGLGLLGTIVGLVQMLGHLDDPKKIGPGLAVSLLSTLYGLILGSVVYGPIAEKIMIHAEKMRELDTMILEGVLLLKEKKSNAHLRDVLNTYSGGAGGARPGAGQARMGSNVGQQAQGSPHPNQNTQIRRS